MGKRYKPKYGNWYWFVELKIGYFEIGSYDWRDDNTDKHLYKTGNCFRTKAEALAMEKKIKKLLKEG